MTSQFSSTYLHRLKKRTAKNECGHIRYFPTIMVSTLIVPGSSGRENKWAGQCTAKCLCVFLLRSMFGLILHLNFI